MGSSMIAQMFGSFSNSCFIAPISLYGTNGNPGVKGPNLAYLDSSSQAPEAVIDLPQKLPYIITT